MAGLKTGEAERVKGRIKRNLTTKHSRYLILLLAGQFLTIGSIDKPVFFLFLHYSFDSTPYLLLYSQISNHKTHILPLLVIIKLILKLSQSLLHRLSPLNVFPAALGIKAAPGWVGFNAMLSGQVYASMKNSFSGCSQHSN